MDKDRKKISIETKVKQKIAIATKLILIVVTISAVLLLSFLAKVISYEFYILTQKNYESVLSSNVIGYVRDIDTNQAISGVEISFNELTVTSDEKGYYKLGLPSVGKYDVVVLGESVGYYNQEENLLPISTLPYVYNIYLKR